ncbi:MAG: fumarylacetoacetate hydrolase family protein [Nitrospiraceae bacterium]|nr:MAG: fumarylacetoacetate hydrolase family protein [Nitrospiraceae bacterium]
MPVKSLAAGLFVHDLYGIAGKEKSMKLIRFGEQQKERPGIITKDGTMYDVSSFGEDYNENFFGTDGLSRLGQWLKTKMSGLPHINDSVRLGPPVCRPSKIVCIGLNFRDHAEEIGLDIPSEPVLFLKSPSALAGPYDNLVLPRNSVHTDWEVELALVMAKKTAYIDEQNAFDHIAGFILFNDYSERDYQFNRGGQWVKGKSADTFASLGPFLVTPDEISDYQNLNMWLKVNNIVKQNGTTANMVFDIPKIISMISQYMTLLPGDIISTGTPPGVGYRKTPAEYLKKGDLVEYGIEGLGEAAQRVVAWDDAR